MALRFPYDSFFESSGNQAAEFQETLRDEILSFSCSIWSQFPDFVVKNRSPGISFTRGFLNQMCSRIQPPVPFPAPPFTGGQCCDKTYNISAQWVLRRCFNNDIISDASGTVTLTGKVKGIFLRPCFNNPSVSCLEAETEECNGSINRGVYFSTTQQIAEGACLTGNPLNPRANDIDPVASEFTITLIETTDGSPDDCGNLPTFYPPTNPTQQDLTTIINITNLDGTNNSYTLTYNQVDSNYNFPLTFKLNGSNVSLGIDGLEISGNPFLTSPTPPNASPPPGSDGARGVDGSDNTQIFEQADYPAFPDFTTPEAILKNIEYVICNNNVIEPVLKAIKIIPSLDPLVGVYLEIFEEIIREVCVNQGGGSAELGFPEVYPVLPGTQRPAIVYYYKELLNGERQRSTFTSTVNNPSANAINSIDTIVVPNKEVGTFVYSILLADGSRISASGNNEVNASVNFFFLFDQVREDVKPQSPEELRVLTIYKRLEERTLNCTQIEFYPNGKAAGVNPTLKRSIPLN